MFSFMDVLLCLKWMKESDVSARVLHYSYLRTLARYILQDIINSFFL